ncbi:MAG: PQQ-binding-like beta-propeller repeat protein [Labilithrix sp.]|nr:PQQ-binding-like beta-propeller repeat protein [Labilithrix sp.]MCW5814165.1 PQQ-binding-like beta-propeller repeat protein [Labilithrix sp.]
MSFARPAVIALTLAGSGCGLGELFAGDRVNPEVPSWYNRPSASMQVFMHRQLTIEGRSNDEDWERGRPEIDAAHERVFVGSSDHGMYALRAGDGSTIWRFETAGLVQSEPLYDPELDLLYFGSNDGALYCVQAATGTLVFRYDSGAEVSRKPVRAGEIIAFANASDYLFGVDRRKGTPKWHARQTPALGMEISGHAGPAYDPATGLVYMAYSAGQVSAYDARDGAEKWTPIDLSAEAEAAGGGDAPRYLDVDTTPVVDAHPNGHVVYVSSYAGGIYALDASSGARVWSNDKAVGVTDLMLYAEPAHAPNEHGPDRGGPTAPAKKMLVASSASSGLMGIDPYTGHVLWRNKVPEGGVTAPTALAGALLVGTSRYGLFLISPRNGKVIDGLDLGSGFSQTPSAYQGRAYVVSNAGTLLGIGVSPPLPVARMKRGGPHEVERRVTGGMLLGRED